VLGEERFAQSLTLADLRFLFAERTGDSNFGSIAQFVAKRAVEDAAPATRG
jgi:hypothetical protein